MAEIEKTCENCKYEFEDFEGTHCRHCIHSAEERFEPKEKTEDELEVELKFLRQWKSDVTEDFCKYDASSVEEIAVHARNKAIDEFAEKISLEISERIIWGMLVDSDKDNSFSDTSDKIVDYVIDTAKKIAEEMKKEGAV